MFKFKRLDPDNIFKHIAKLPEGLESLRLSIGTTISEKLREDVIKRIPNSSGWLAIYRKSIDFYYNGKEWSVAGETDGGNIKNYDSETTLLTFSATDPTTKILVKYNDWPLDIVPALNTSYSGRVIIKSASKTQVTLKRQQILNLMPKILQELRASGFDVKEYGVPLLNGTLTADLKAFSKQLEEGRGDYPFPPVPHWRPAAESISGDIKSSIEVSKEKFKSILSGNIPDRPRPMSSLMRSTISAYAKRAP